MCVCFHLNPAKYLHRIYGVFIIALLTVILISTKGLKLLHKHED